jgi:uncharacterized protein YegP (UPF0339 family)
MKKHPLFEVFSGNNSEVYFRLTSEQGETILVSEAQPNSNTAYRVINQISDPKYLEKSIQRLTMTDKQFTFQISSARQGVLANGPVFSQELSCNKCIETLLSCAPIAEIEDYS